MVPVAVADYPGRRRRGEGGRGQARPTQPRRQNNGNGIGIGGSSRSGSGPSHSHAHRYCLASLAVALLAVVAAPVGRPIIAPPSPHPGASAVGGRSGGEADGKDAEAEIRRRQRSFRPPASYSDLLRPFADVVLGLGRGGDGSADGVDAGSDDADASPAGGDDRSRHLLPGLWDDWLGGGAWRTWSSGGPTPAGGLGDDDAGPSSPPGWLGWLARRDAGLDETNDANGEGSQSRRRGGGRKRDRRRDDDDADDDSSGNGSSHSAESDPSFHAHSRAARRVGRSLLRALAGLVDPSIRRLIAATAASTGWRTATSGPASGSGLASASSAASASTAAASVLTEVVDKVLTSTPRLLAIANLLLAATYLLHGAVAEFFLGGGGGGGGIGIGVGGRQGLGQILGLGARDPAAAPIPPPTRLNRSNRERLGGYLLFKLLLVSAVVEPDTLDLLILLSWYTLLSFLRSLAHLAGTATTHAAQTGSGAPSRGVLRLLVAVLAADFGAAALCAGLFSGAGWGTVLLLACDCALLAVDALAHCARHAGQVLEERHSAEVGALEDAQLRLGGEEEARLLSSSFSSSSSNDGREDEQSGDASIPTTDTEDHADADINTANADNTEIPEETQAHVRDRARRESRRIDRRIELCESLHCRRISVLDRVVFGLELAAYLLTISHFLHIWSLHGVSFGLVDCVLALHLHSAVSAMGKKIGERRNLNRIAQSLDHHFSDATELELRKSQAAGDVCSVCLGTMSGLRNVKKVGCGHLYHTHCLREVVERATSIEAAKCPLCRACILDGSQPGQRNMLPAEAGQQPQQQQQQQQQQPAENQQAQVTDGVPDQQTLQQQGARDQALFSFSTENILPNWLPIPALSFEIVRRPATNATAEAQRTGAADTGDGNNGPPERFNPQQRQQGQTSFWRRLLILSGVVPMSPEEEAAALESLTDMFPQYERHDLLRELRLRGSAEGVVEAVLAGVFSGVARGNGNAVAIVDQPGGNGNLFEQDDNSIIADADHDEALDGDTGEGDDQNRE